MRRGLATRRAAFVLLEAMIAVMVFSIGVIALGRCVENCLAGERFKNDDARARLALLNRMAEIEAGAAVTDKSREALKGMFEGMTMKVSRTPLKKKNEKNQELFGIFAITLEVEWKDGGVDHSRQLSFYVYPRQR